MHAFNRFEANLLKILYAVLGDVSIGQVMPIVNQQYAYSGCLSRACVELVQATLAKGMTHWLATRGGWQSERYLRGEQPATGAIWQRSEPRELGLTFSPASLRFLVWLTAHDPLDESADPWHEIQSATELTAGDQLLLLRTLQRFVDNKIADRWLRMRKFASQPLVALCYPDLIAVRERPVTLDFDSQLPELANVLECLQPFLVRRWTEVEESKALIADADGIGRLGAVQANVLTSYLLAAAKHGRRDLARFLLVAFQQLVSSDVPPDQLARQWIRGLRLGHMRLAERTIVYRSASSFLATAAQLRAWTAECRQVGYFDEGYAAAQLWLSDWARYDGETTTLRATAMMLSLNP